MGLVLHYRAHGFAVRSSLYGRYVLSLIHSVQPVCSRRMLMLEMLGYIAARVIAGVITALILAAIFNAQCNKAMQAAGASAAIC